MRLHSTEITSILSFPNEMLINGEEHEVHVVLRVLRALRGLIQNDKKKHFL